MAFSPPLFFLPVVNHSPCRFLTSTVGPPLLLKMCLLIMTALCRFGGAVPPLFSPAFPFFNEFVWSRPRFVFFDLRGWFFLVFIFGKKFFRSCPSPFLPVYIGPRFPPFLIGPHCIAQQKPDSVRFPRSSPSPPPPLIVSWLVLWPVRYPLSPSVLGQNQLDLRAPPNFFFLSRRLFRFGYAFCFLSHRAGTSFSPPVG